MIICKNCGFEIKKYGSEWLIKDINLKYRRAEYSFMTYCIVSGVSIPHEPYMKNNNFKSLYNKLL